MPTAELMLTEAVIRHRREQKRKRYLEDHINNLRQLIQMNAPHETISSECLLVVQAYCDGRFSTFWHMVRGIFQCQKV